MKYKKKKLSEYVSEIYQITIESDELKFEGDSFTNLNFYNLLCKAALSNKLYTTGNINICMFNCFLDNEEAVLMIFGHAIRPELPTKSLSERLMNNVKSLEEAFISLDFLRSEEVKSDKNVYITAIKKN